ncbi:MAG: hypothetical protein EAZ87_16900 [Nostocales cyanobacterium]|nr:MAG: hypothetical protein EAZ87_16900 [Nostocales cyanobacterium]
MIISDLNILENVSGSEVVGGFFTSGNNFSSSYDQEDQIKIKFKSKNEFDTIVNTPKTYSNSASAGAKGDAINNSFFPTYSFTKADTVAVAKFGGGSFSGSTSAAVINPVFD